MALVDVVDPADGQDPGRAAMRPQPGRLVAFGGRPADPDSLETAVERLGPGRRIVRMGEQGIRAPDRDDPIAAGPFPDLDAVHIAQIGPPKKRHYDAYYLKAQKVRTLIRREFDAAFQKCDALVTAVSPTPAFKLGEKTADPLQMYLSDVCTIPVNIAGIPAISVPCGFAPAGGGSASGGDGLPVGLHIMAKPFDEPTILRVAYAYEQATEWHKARPKL